MMDMDSAMQKTVLLLNKWYNLRKRVYNYLEMLNKFKPSRRRDLIFIKSTKKSKGSFKKSLKID